MAKQTIFGRIAQLTKANINALIDAAEDPEKMLDQMVRDYTNNIREAEAAVAQTIGNLRLLEKDHAEDVKALRSGAPRLWQLLTRLMSSAQLATLPTLTSSITSRRLL